jgi:hypothetical protein
MVSVLRSRSAFLAMEQSGFSGDAALVGQTRSGMLDAHPGQDVLPSYNFIE